MRKPNLIQRLMKPFKSDKSETLDKLIEALSFGGGLINGGLKKEAMELLRPIFSFAYMGSAEFEWGAVPKAINKIASNMVDYESFEILIDMADVKENTQRRWNKQATASVRDVGKKPVYILCHKNNKKDVEAIIRMLAKEEHRMQEVSRFDCALDPVDKDLRNPQGWLELDDGYMFFLSKDMCNQTVELFTAVANSLVPKAGK